MRSGEFRAIPIIAVTAYEEMANEEHCATVGMDNILYKPLTIEVLRNALEKFNL